MPKLQCRSVKRNRPGSGSFFRPVVIGLPHRRWGRWGWGRPYSPSARESGRRASSSSVPQSIRHGSPRRSPRPGPRRYGGASCRRSTWCGSSSGWACSTIAASRRSCSISTSSCPRGTAAGATSPTPPSSKRATSSAPSRWPRSSRRPPRCGAPRRPTPPAGAGWPSTASTARRCAWPTRGRTSRASGARAVATGRARATRSCGWSRSRSCATTSSPLPPSARTARASSPWRPRCGGAVPDRALVILDRDFCSYALFHALAEPACQRHWLVRAKAGRTALTAPVVQRLGPGDHLGGLTPSRATRTAHRPLPATLRVRAVRVHHRGFRPYLVFTSLLDPVAYPAAELVALYHERWELELTFDEVKTHTLERAEALRSQAPTRVDQEVWGLLLAYNLLRLVMSRAAPRADAAAPELSPRAPRPARLLAHGLALAARRPAAPPRGPARRTRALRAARAPAPPLPPHRQDQNEQLPA